MSNQTKDLSRQISALNRTVQSLGAHVLDLMDRFGVHEIAEGAVLAKAASMTTPSAPNADLARLTERVQHLEEAAHLATLPGGALDGERLLAKAAGAYLEPESLMALGEREIADATTMGIFASHISTGNLTAAQNVLIDVRERGRVAKAADVAQHVESSLEEPLSDYANRRGLSELVARFGELERTLASIESRLERLERPQPVPVQQPSGQTVAKAAGGGKVRTPKTREQIADGLLRAIDMYVDSPGVAGALSSLVQQGKFSEARPLIEKAKQAHEVERVKQERKSWGR